MSSMTPDELQAIRERAKSIKAFYESRDARENAERGHGHTMTVVPLADACLTLLAEVERLEALAQQLAEALRLMYARWRPYIPTGKASKTVEVVMEAALAAYDAAMGEKEKEIKE